MSGSIAGIILAGGQSVRMGGGEKFLLPLAGQPLIAHVTERLRMQVNALAVSANCAPGKLAFLDLPILPDDGAPQGPLSGVLAGMEWARRQGGISAIVTAAADTPFAPRDLAARLEAAVTADSPIAMASSGERLHPTFGFWPLEIADALARYLPLADDTSVLRFARRSGVAEVPFDTVAGCDPFFNVNMPADLDEAAGIAQKIGA